MSHVYNLSNFSFISNKFQILYQNINFLKCDAIFIWLSIKTFEDFERIAKFANAIRKDIISFKKIRVTDSRKLIYVNRFT